MPKVVDHDARRAELVQATCSVIASEGLDAATVRRIAEAAGYTTGFVTHYFDTKDDLLIAALRSVHLAAARRMESILATRTGRDALRAVVLESLPLDPTRRIEWQVWVAFWGRAGTNPALSAEQHRRYAQWRGLLDQLVADAEPALDATRVGTASTLLAAGIDGLGLQATLEPRRFPRRTIEHLADASLDAVLPS